MSATRVIPPISVADLPIGFGPGNIPDWDLLGEPQAASYIGYDPTNLGLDPTDPYLQGAIEGIVSGKVSQIFVFDPNRSSNDGNQYNNWPDLYAALSTHIPPGVRKVVQFAKKNSGTTTIPAGSYDLSGVEFEGQPQNGFTPIAIADGATIAGGALAPWRWSGGLVVDFQGHTPFWSSSTKFQWLFLDQQTTFGSSGTAAPFSCSGSAEIHSVLNDGSVFQTPTGGADAITEATGTGTIITDIGTFSTVQTHTLNGAVGTFTSENIQTATSVYSPTQTLSGTNTVTPNYVAASAPNWSGTAPSSIANALDRIAAKIGPIA